MLPVVSCPDIYEAYLASYQQAFADFHDKKITASRLLDEKAYAEAEREEDCIVRLEQKFHVRLFWDR
jgi:hypothetical protein